jgi:UDP-galactopyranose mutase
MPEYDYLIVGAGLYGSVFAHEMNKRGKRCLVIDKRNHIGGNCYTEKIEGIHVHKYGAHIFHTSNKEVWDYMNSLVEFNRYTNSPVARWKDELYNLPFNMNTFHQLWGVKTPAEALAKIEEQRSVMAGKNPTNLEEQAISLVGSDIYERLIKGYTEKQWGRKCTELPAFIIRRLPVRFTFDNNYFNDKYQGIPNGGYTRIFEKLLEETNTQLGIDYLKNRTELDQLAEKTLYTGPIDAFYEYQYGELGYRSLRFETEILSIENFQGNAVVNYTEASVPYTRIIEHKHFEFGNQEKTVISREYSTDWHLGIEPYYPINDNINTSLYAKYKALADFETRYLFGGRLSDYKYYDMHQVIGSALEMVYQIEKGQ